MSENMAPQIRDTEKSSKKRKRAEDAEDAVKPESADAEKPSKKEKKAKKEKYEKKGNKEQKEKKDKKKKKARTEDKSDSVPEEQKIETKAVFAPEPATETPVAPVEDVSDENAGKKGKFIVFIGNLPYSATTEKIQQHFAKIQPMSVRHNTDKATGKSRGFAFLEFDAYDRMKTCLKLYHHSLFEDGKTEGRKINVELTAGGGGSKSKQRKQKIKDKNEKLEQQRARMIQSNKQRKEQKEVKEKAEPAQAEQGPQDGSDIHPSRRHLMR